MTAWATRPLAELCTIKPPKAEARAKLAGSDEVSFVPMEDLGIGVKHVVPTRTRRFDEVAGSYTYFADGDVLLAKITPCFENGKLGVARDLVNGVGFGSSEYVVLRPGPELDAEFLYYFLARATFREEGARTMTGAVGHKRIAKEFVEGQQIPLPPPSQQRRIVGLLDEALDGVAVAKALAEKNLASARDVFHAKRAAIFAEHRAVWPVEQLGQVAEVMSGGTPLVSNKAFWGGEIAWYSSGELNDTATMEPERYITKAGLAGSNAKLFPKGSLLIGMYDTAALKMSLLDRDGAFNQAIAGVKPNNKIDLEFVLHAINVIKPQILDQRRGVRQKNLSLTKIREIPVPAPDVAVQQKVVGALRDVQQQVERLEEIFEQKVQLLSALKQSLLHHAFTGNL
jgi:type I restriction enzyme S subunit